MLRCAYPSPHGTRALSSGAYTKDRTTDASSHEAACEREYWLIDGVRRTRAGTGLDGGGGSLPSARAPVGRPGPTQLRVRDLIPQPRRGGQTRQRPGVRPPQVFPSARRRARCPTLEQQNRPTRLLLPYFTAAALGARPGSGKESVHRPGLDAAGTALMSAGHV